MSQRHFKLSTESHVITCTKYNGILWQSYNNRDIYNDIQKHQCTCLPSRYHTIFLSQPSSHQQVPLLKTVSALHGSFCSYLFPPTHRPALSAPCCTAHLLPLRHQRFPSVFSSIKTTYGEFSCPRDQRTGSNLCLSCLSVCPPL